MKAVCITAAVLALASVGLAQSGATSASSPAAAGSAEGRVSNSHIHLFTKDPEVQRHFWVDVMGATAGRMGPDRNMYTLPKVLVIVDKGNLIFSPTDTPVTGTKGRALDHIGFEVKDLKGFTKTLEANGVKLDSPYRKIPQMGFAVAFLTDPWGTRIELTERSAPAPSAQGPKPALQ